MHVCMHVCMHVYAHIHTYIHTYIYTRTGSRVLGKVHVHMHTYIPAERNDHTYKELEKVFVQGAYKAHVHTYMYACIHTYLQREMIIRIRSWRRSSCKERIRRTYIHICMRVYIPVERRSRAYKELEKVFVQGAYKAHVDTYMYACIHTC